MRWAFACLVAACGVISPTFDRRCNPPLILPPFNYSVSANGSTPSGIGIDDSGQHGIVDPVAVDARFAAVEACLANLGFQPVPHECLTVKVPSDWVIGCTGQEVLPHTGNPAGCREKGLEPTQACPCRYRGWMQGNTLVTTPSLVTLGASLVSRVTGNADPWHVQNLALCSSK
jgi:hypothetical protein